MSDEMKIAVRYDVPLCGVDCPECGAKILAPRVEPWKGEETIRGRTGVAHLCAECGACFLAVEPQ